MIFAFIFRIFLSFPGFKNWVHISQIIKINTKRNRHTLYFPGLSRFLSYSCFLWTKQYSPWTCPICHQPFTQGQPCSSPRVLILRSCHVDKFRDSAIQGNDATRHQFILVGVESRSQLSIREFPQAMHKMKTWQRSGHSKGDNKGNEYCSSPWSLVNKMHRTDPGKGRQPGPWLSGSWWVFSLNDYKTQGVNIHIQNPCCFSVRSSQDRCFGGRHTCVQILVLLPPIHVPVPGHHLL
jgi:hypothetical protein